MRWATYSGAAVADVIAPLAALRMRVFYDFPYLYEGSLDYETHYLGRYAAVADSFVLTLWDGDQLVGATTGMPLLHELPDIRQPLEQAQVPVASVFYFGESILLPAYRGRGYGHRFFDAREAFAQAQGFTAATFCAVLRPPDHPLRPADYRPNDAFWAKRGYTPQPDWVCHLHWQDRDEPTETAKPLQFWYRSWGGNG